MKSIPPGAAPPARPETAAPESAPAAEPEAEREAVPEPPATGSLTAGHRVPLAVITAVAAAMYGTLALVRFVRFRAGTYDLVIFDQAVRSYAELRQGIAVVKGVHNGFGPDFSVLGDHWSPILALLAPLYWIHDGPATLLVAQAVLLALPVPVLWVFTRRAFAGRRGGTIAAYLVAAAYALSWPVADAAAFDFHEAAFVPPLVAIMLERFQAGRAGVMIAAALGLLLVKEDMGLLVAGFGCCLAVTGGAGRSRIARQRLIGVAFLVTGFVSTAVATQVLIPAFGGRADYYWAYGALGGDPGEVLRATLADPLRTLAQLWTPSVKVETVVLLLATFAFLPLLSPLALAAAPPLVVRMLASEFPNWWASDFHYNSFVVVVLACAAVDGAVRLARWGERAGRRWRRIRPARPAARLVAGLPVLYGAAAVVIAAALIPTSSLRNLADPGYYAHDERMKSAAAAAAAVPDGVTVEAANYVGPRLSGRTTVLLWDWEPRWAPWVVAEVGRRTFPFTSVTEQWDRVALLERSGYRRVLVSGTYVVLHRSGSPAGPATPG